MFENRLKTVQKTYSTHGSKYLWEGVKIEDTSIFIRAKGVSNTYLTKKKVACLRVCVCVCVPF